MGEKASTISDASVKGSNDICNLDDNGIEDKPT